MVWKSISTIVVEILLFSDPRLDDAEPRLPDDAPVAFLMGFPLDKGLCNGQQDYIQHMPYPLSEELCGTTKQE